MGTANEESYSGAVAKVEAMVWTNTVSYEVMQVEQDDVVTGCDEGLFEPLDWSELGNPKTLLKQRYRLTAGLRLAILIRPRKRVFWLLKRFGIDMCLKFISKRFKGSAGVFHPKHFHGVLLCVSQICLMSRSAIDLMSLGLGVAHFVSLKGLCPSVPLFEGNLTPGYW
ncbi:hypothetical protein SAMN04488527_11379 [Aliiroseovarius crassostreae]|nr:hypothetical protein SAMN04488527_11379 [Aliiroseovarius crassostreae]